jgi:hypothetical protein
MRKQYMYGTSELTCIGREFIYVYSFLCGIGSGLGFLFSLLRIGEIYSD